MPFVDRLPPDLEDAAQLLLRRDAAAKKKELWRSLLQDCYRFACPTRELFSWQTEGAFKNNVLYDSTLQESTYTAANTLVATLFPPWQRWSGLSPGGDIPKKDVSKAIVEGLQEATEIFFDFLDDSNFASISNEVALDLQIGTAALQFDEGETDAKPFHFSAIPLAALELEEGPNGTIETNFMCRKPSMRNLIRMYPGLEVFDLPVELQDTFVQTPDKEVEIVQGTVYSPVTKRYYGVVVWTAGKRFLWRFDYGETSPSIVARASKIAGETYGRGRVMLALSDARTLDKMQEFVLRHSALQIAPPMTGVSDGVLNPFTAVLAPNTILPVASNDSRNPSLSVVEFGGNFAISAEIMNFLRERIRRTLIGPEPSDGPVKSATEISIADRNRLWALGGEYGRIQTEFLAKVVARGIDILQRRGLIPKLKVDGRMVAVKFTSPFARSQDAEDLLALDNTLGRLATIPGSMEVGLKVDLLPEWISRKTGLDQKLVNDESERAKIKKDAAAAAAQLAEQAQSAGMMPGAGGAQ